MDDLREYFNTEHMALELVRFLRKVHVVECSAIAGVALLADCGYPSVRFLCGPGQWSCCFELRLLPFTTDLI